jgi:cytochrome c oxidase subunit 4
MTAVTPSEELDREEEVTELGHDHPEIGTYWLVGGVLAALTALEISTYWWPKGMHRATHVALIIMMVIKFALVALFFMHLKFDARLLRRAFFFGLGLALTVYIVMLSTFVYWDHSGDLKDRFPNPPRSRPIPPPPTTPPPTIAAK